MKNYVNDYFQSSDLCLITVISLHFPIDSLENTNTQRVNFFFKRSKELDELIQAYWKCELKVEPQQFFNQLKVIKNRIYSDR